MELFSHHFFGVGSNPSWGKNFFLIFLPNRTKPGDQTMSFFYLVPDHIQPKKALGAESCRTMTFIFGSFYAMKSHFQSSVNAIFTIRIALLLFDLIILVNIERKKAKKGKDFECLKMGLINGFRSPRSLCKAQVCIWLLTSIANVHCRNCRF